MKNNIKSNITLLALGSMLLCPIASHARVVENINQSMTTLLGHAPLVTNVYEAQKQGLNDSNSKFQPWSSSYWPDILGGISSHYQTRSFVGNLLFFILKYDAAKGRVMDDHKDVCNKYDMWNEEEFNKHLSPTEKYDLLLGDTNFTFSKAIMDDIDFRSKYKKTTVMMDGSDASDSDGDDNNDKFADVQSSYAGLDSKIAYKYWKKKGNSIAYWFGICDGWSPASIYLPRPTNPVTVTGALGHQITFTPDDLKALGSYLFARTNNDYMTTMNYNFAGRPCAGSPSGPEVFPDGSKNAGMIKDFHCNDVDAGVWHLTLLNRIGKDRMGFMMDVDNNKKINNHPVGVYSLTYFNPATGVEGEMKDSVTPISSVKDAYHARRHPNAQYLLGVKSKIRFRYYQWPEAHRSKKVYDGEENDIFKEKVYSYDLELDTNGNVLGGEWGDRSQEVQTSDDEDGQQIVKAIAAEQPDFIWMAAPNVLPYSEMSVYTMMGTKIDQNNPRPFGNMKWAWDGKSPLPADWVRAAKQDETWYPPTVGEQVEVAGSKMKDVVPNNAKDAIMKSAQPLSNIIYYLFDRSRTSTEK